MNITPRAEFAFIFFFELHFTTALYIKARAALCVLVLLDGPFVFFYTG